ncbi:hypothetical protein Q6272_33170, partial [Klebsiella pneumoniae]|uniref:hypothetical protein n=1 Tax=Klebsiella pneumoniae TaxID=573 RepID=UPI00272F95E1
APLPCDGGNCPTGTSYTFFTDENEFLDVLEAGFYDEDFAGIPVGDAGPSLSFGGNGFSYTVTAYGNGSCLLFNDPGLL